MPNFISLPSVCFSWTFEKSCKWEGIWFACDCWLVMIKFEKAGRYRFHSDPSVLPCLCLLCNSLELVVFSFSVEALWLYASFQIWFRLHLLQKHWLVPCNLLFQKFTQANTISLCSHNPYNASVSWHLVYSTLVLFLYVCLLPQTVDYLRQRLWYWALNSQCPYKAGHMVGVWYSLIKGMNEWSQ